MNTVLFTASNKWLEYLTLAMKVVKAGGDIATIAKDVYDQHKKGGAPSPTAMNKLKAQEKALEDAILGADPEKDRGA